MTFTSCVLDIKSYQDLKKKIKLYLEMDQIDFKLVKCNQLYPTDESAVQTGFTESAF